MKFLKECFLRTNDPKTAAKQLREVLLAYKVVNTISNGIWEILENFKLLFLQNLTHQKSCPLKII